MNKNYLKIFSLLLCLLTSIISAQIDTSLFNQASLTESVTIVDCTLSNGSTTKCYQLKFFANDVNDDGPFCPETIDDIGGMAIYKPGSAGTDVGLAAINEALLNIIEADGFDIVQTNGDVNINNPGASGSAPVSGTSYCLQAEKDNDLELVYLIPVSPEDLSTPNEIETVEQLGVSLNGIPFKGDPPSVIGGGPGGGRGSSDVLMPSLDACGGHHDPAGYYHWHMVANSTNEVLSDLNITEISCTNFAQNNSSLMGYAMDGYPIYGQYELGNTLPTDLDSCNGHFGVTDEYPSSIYHYHAVAGTAPNTPPCLKGASANDNFTYSFHTNTLSNSNLDIEISNDKLYPNPSKGNLIIVKTTANEISIIDNLGKKVKSNNLIIKSEDGFMIQTLNLSDGIYHIILIKGNSKISKKIIVTKNR